MLVTQTLEHFPKLYVVCGTAFSYRRSVERDPKETVTSRWGHTPIVADVERGYQLDRASDRVSRPA